MRSQRGAAEKKPWKDLPSLEGVVETEFLRPIHLGETVVAHRALAPRLGVIPRDADAILNANDADIDQYPGMAEWWRTANQMWEANSVKKKSADDVTETVKMSLTERLDYHRELSAQFPIPDIRVVYGKSGMHLAAARVVDHRAVIDHTLYWAAARSSEEAWYLCAILNAAATTQATRPLMSRGKEERHIDTYVWQLPIPEYDDHDETHRRLSELGKEAESVAAAMEVGPGESFVTLRRRLRALFAEHPVGRSIERIVAPMLPPPMLESVYAKVSDGASRAALTEIYDALDERLLDGELDAAGWILDAVEVSRLDVTTALGFLSVTLAARDRLPARRDLVDRVAEWLRAKDPARVASLLEGLTP
ncbi:MAG: hypothetical protein R3A52_06710 [Polyangiales bacterium]